MKRVSFSLAAWLLVGVVVAASQASAGDRAPVFKPLPPGPVTKVTVGDVYAGPTCQLGETSLQRNTLDLITPPDDFYYILLDPEDCVSCVGTDSIRIESVGLKLFYAADCSISVKVAIVDTNGVLCLPPCGAPCPNDGGLIWGPMTFPLVGTAAGAIHEFTLDLPGTVLFTGGAYLRFEFFELGTGCDQPELVYGNPLTCPRCTFYNLSILPPIDDLCDPASSPVGRAIMYANVASCVTPTLPSSWGAIKAIYRSP